MTQIPKIKKVYVAKHSATVETLQTSYIAGYFEDSWKVPRMLSLDLEAFEVPDIILEEITCAMCRCATQMAPGPDLIINEALVLFIAELVKACGRIDTVQMAR